jgi:hypothetical protein
VTASRDLDLSHPSAPPEAVYIIRHGEKPSDHAPKHPAAHSGQLFEIERSFRMAKSDLQAGPSTTTCVTRSKPT